jgi:uncharacterized membrane protein
MIDGYLRRLDRALADAPPATRRELVEDVRGHITEAWDNAPQRDRATLLNILERLGEPEGLAREEYERLGIQPAGHGQGPDLLSAAAVVLTVLFWPAGVVLAWLSDRWSTRDKAIATLLPTLGLVLGLTLSVAAFSTVTQGVAHQIEVNVESGAPAPSPSQPPVQATRLAESAGSLFARAFGLYCFFGAPLTAAVYLAWRLRRGPRRGTALGAVLVGAIVAGTLILGLLLPAANYSGAGSGMVRAASGVTQQVR